VRARHPGSLFALLAWLALSLSRGQGVAVLCVHKDGGTALETGLDRCCREGGAGHRKAAATLTAAGGCEGCEDRVLGLDFRPDPSRPAPVAIGFVELVMAAPATGLLAGEPSRPWALARGAPPPLPLRV
jgi:hypothetical protein